MTLKPTKEEIDAQVEKLCEGALYQKQQQAKILRYLIHIPRDDQRPGKQILGDIFQPVKSRAKQPEAQGRQLIASLRESLKRYYWQLPPEEPDPVVIEIPSGRGTSYRPRYSYRNAAPAKGVDVLATFSEWPMDIAQKIRNCQRKLVVCITGWSNLGSYLPAITDILREGREVEVAFWKPNSDFAKLRASNVDPDLLRNIVAPNFKVFEKIKKKHPEQRLTIYPCDGWGSVSLFWIDDLIYFGMYWVHIYSVHGPHFLVSANSTTGRRLQQEYKAMIGSGNRATCRFPKSKTSPRNVKPK